MKHTLCQPYQHFRVTLQSMNEIYLIYLAATDQIVNALCMNVHEDGSMVPSKSMTHSVLLSGLFIGGFKTCVKCRMAIDEGNGVTLEVRVKSSNYDVAELVANSIY